MISGANLYAVAKAMAPLYTAMALGYISVKYLRAFTPDQCAGINHFVALYALPLLIFRMVASNNPYTMSGRLLAADTLQKIILLAILFAWAYWANNRQKKSPPSASSSTPLQWVVTIFSLASLPNTIIMGVPLLGGMYGSMSAGLMVQIVVLQFCIWYNLVIFLYEYMAAKRAVLAKGHQVLPARVTEQISKSEVAMQEKESSTEATQTQNEVCVTIIEAAELATSDQSETSEDETSQPEIPKTGIQVTAKVPDQRVHEETPVPTVAVKVVVSMAMKKLLKIPNTYASFLGLLWSLMASKVGIRLPEIVDDSLAIVSTTAVGLSMFTAGTFLARQTQFIPCGYSKAILSILIRFIIGPLLMAITSFAMGLHGTLLHIAIVQAALPLAVSSFVYAEEYKLHADIMSTGIIIGNFVSLPFTIMYYILTGL
ncbi:Auxin efflux carrier component [Rhynchospora pubera]|uniref:Auxin efflux carrier component n=1 Tax=Rhynchospora pubera TaxID=906938 RepID=A0AAV8FXE9_9POAL|nr:Auxin efflux carrier component [Rhynchospora pubera]